MVQQLIWPKNHTSNKKIYFNEFVANVLRDVIGIVIFDLRGHGGCQRPKTPLGGQNYHERVDLLKKVFNESFSATSKTPQKLQSDLSYDLSKKDAATSEVTYREDREGRELDLMPVNFFFKLLIMKKEQKKLVSKYLIK